MDKKEPTEKQKVGQLGEGVACEFLKKHSYKIIDRNYRKKWGEIDIVATKNNILHFVEVKAVTVKEVRLPSDSYEPEENVHPWKLKRLSRVIQTYLLSKKIPDETEWQLDILSVFLDFKTRKARFRLTENVIL